MIMANITIIQYAPQENTPDKNIRYVLQKASYLHDTLIVLPEFGFSSYEKFAFIPSDNLASFLEPLINSCKKNSVAFVTSMPVVQDEKRYNRGVYITKDTISIKDKRQLFGNEIGKLEVGNNNPLLEYDKTPFIIQVCLDIIKPIQSYEAVLSGAKFILNPATVSMDYLWSINKARSLENGVPVIFCNRSGKEASGTQYLGRSTIFFPDGTEKTIESSEGVLTLSV